MNSGGGAAHAEIPRAILVGIEPPVATNESPWLRRSWHVVATSSEITTAPTQVWLLGEPWVLVRIDGLVVAFVDRCPHRLAPLSAGTLVDGQLRCGYHGWEFRADGACTRIPSMGDGAVLPPRARATEPFAVEERYGLVWLAPEAPVCDIIDFPDWEDERFDRSWTVPRRATISALHLADNFFDSAHFPTVHPSTFGTPEAAYLAPHTVERDGWELRTQYETPYRNLDDPLVATGDHPLVQPHVLTTIGRPPATVHLTLDFPLTGERLAILFACQPERVGSTRLYKLMASSGTAGDAERIADLVAFEERVLDEDLAILDRYPAGEGLPLDLTREVHTGADRLSVAYRRLLCDLVS